MGEGLREVPDLTVHPRVIFFSEKSDVVAQGEEMLEHLARVVVSAEQFVVVGEPKAAGEERALAAGQAVVRRGAVVAEHESVDEQSLLDLLDGAAHAFIVGREESDERDHERARIEQLGAVRLHERAELTVEAALAHFAMDLFAKRAPAVDDAVSAKLLGALDGTVDRDPGHDFRVCEMLWSATYLPHPLIRSLPDGGKVLHERLLKAPRVEAARQAGAPALVKCVHDLTEHIELQLTVRGVADTHWFRALIARQPVDLPLAQHMLAGEPVHDLDLLGTPGGRSEQPVAPGRGLIEVAGVHQRQ